MWTLEPDDSVTLDKVVNLSVPQFPYSYTGNITRQTVIEYCCYEKCLECIWGVG